MARVLFVTKPIAPPWTDGTRNLVRDLARALGPEQAELLVPRGVEIPGCATRAIYPSRPPKHATSRSEQARLVLHLGLAPLPPLLHWFFTPSNPSVAALPGALGRARRRRTVWTIPSLPPGELALGALPGVDRVIALSESTARALVRGGVPRGKLSVVQPWVEDPPAPAPADVAALRIALGLRERMVLYPGDLGPGRGADLAVEAFARGASAADVLVIAARPKGTHARAARRALTQQVDTLGIGARVRFVDVVPDMRALLAASDVVLLPATTLEAKVDIPLVLIEALLATRAVIVAEGAPPADLAVRGAARAVPADAAKLGAALAALLSASGDREALGAAGRAVALRDHAPKALARIHEALYDELVS